MVRGQGNQMPKNQLGKLQQGTKTAHQKIGVYLVLAGPPPNGEMVWPQGGRWQNVHGEGRADIAAAAGITIHLACLQASAPDNRFHARFRFDPGRIFQEKVEVVPSKKGEKPTWEDTKAALWDSIKGSWTEEQIEQELTRNKIKIPSHE